MNRIGMKAAAVCIALSIFVGMAASRSYETPSINADTTIAELEAQREENNKLIEQYEQELAGYAADQKEQEEYQAALQLKIDTLQENMLILDTELETIKEEIYNLDIAIADLEVTIAQQKLDIEDGLEQFKLRLRAMYVNGNNSLASALVGATDFYDLLSKYEMISCVARHDDELVNELKAELEAYNTNLATLETQKAELETAKAEADAKRAEMEVSMEDLQATFQESVAEQQRLENEQAAKEKTIEELEAENAQLEADEAEIQAAIERAEEEARKKAEEEQKRKEEEAAQQQQQQQEQENSGGGGSSDSGDSGTVEETPSYSGDSFGWPCPGHYYISSYYGYRWGRLHKGYDIANNAGATVVASRAGTVIGVNTGCSHNYPKSGNCCGNGYGNYVLLMHDDGTFSTMYAHMESVYVSVGEYVGKGQALGIVGCTGYSTGYHLHFEIRKNGTAVNPGDYLNY